MTINKETKEKARNQTMFRRLSFSFVSKARKTQLVPVCGRPSRRFHPFSPPEPPTPPPQNRLPDSRGPLRVRRRIRQVASPTMEEVGRCYATFRDSHSKQPVPARLGSMTCLLQYRRRLDWPIYPFPGPWLKKDSLFPISCQSRKANVRLRKWGSEVGVIISYYRFARAISIACFTPYVVTFHVNRDSSY